MTPILKHLEKLKGSKDCFQESTLEVLLEEGLASSQPQLERAIHVMEYLAQLRSAGLDPLFKGGSAVQLLLPVALQRLSVDLDVAVLDKEPLQDCMQKVSERFTNDFYDARLRTEPGPDSMFLDYRVRIPTYGAGIIEMKLDVLLHEPSYATQYTPLETFFFHSDVDVRTPTIDSMLGDKLTTLGPNSIGRPLKHSGMGLEYIKHLFDIGNLLQHFADFRSVRTAYEDCLHFQKDLRALGPSFDISEGLRDLTYVCKFLTLDDESLVSAKAIVPDQHSSIENHYTSCMGSSRSGIRRISPFLGRGIVLTRRQVRNLVGRIAFLASLLELTSAGHLEDSVAGQSLSALEDTVSEILDDDGLTSLIAAIENKPLLDRWHLDISILETISPEVLVYWYAAYFPTEFLETYIE